MLHIYKADPGVSWREEFSIALFFVIAGIVLHFGLTSFFFIYEDDYFHIGVPANESWEWIVNQIRYVWTTWPQGRPGIFTFLALEGGIISTTGSVALAYLPPLFIVSANGYLSYRIFAVRFSQRASFFGAMFSMASCADPHRILLTHSVLQIGILLNLIGVLLYLRGHYIVAYLVAGSSLLFYEITFAIFACAELFSCLGTKIHYRQLARAWSAWISVAIMVFVFRYSQGESRVVEATSNVSELVQRIITNISWGPLYGLQNSYVHPFGQVFQQPVALLLLFSVGAVTGCLLLAWPLLSPSPNDENRHRDFSWIALWPILILLCFGPYALQLKRTVFAGYMRPVSGYHLCLGLSLGLAVTALWFWAETKSKRLRWLVACLALLATTSTYQNMLIQSDYARSARYQSHFWSELARIAGDARPGDVILVPRQELLETSYLLSNSWGTTHAWNILFKQTSALTNWFSIPDHRPATVFLVPIGWENNVKREADGLVLELGEYTPPGFHIGKVPLTDNHLIVVDAHYSLPFTRRKEPIMTAAGSVMPKPIPTNSNNLPYTPLARYLFDNFVN